MSTDSNRKTNTMNFLGGRKRGDSHATSKTQRKEGLSRSEAFTMLGMLAVVLAVTLLVFGPGHIGFSQKSALAPGTPPTAYEIVDEEPGGLTSTLSGAEKVAAVIAHMDLDDVTEVTVARTLNGNDLVVSTKPHRDHYLVNDVQFPNDADFNPEADYVTGTKFVACVRDSDGAAYIVTLSDPMMKGVWVDCNGQ